MAKLAGETYGEALYELAVSNNCTVSLMEEVETVRRILSDNPDFGVLLLHPGISKPEKLDMVSQVFDGRVSPLLSGFFKELIEKDRYGDLDSIFDNFIAKVKEEQGIGIAWVASAKELTGRQKDQVEEKLLATTQYRSMEMHYSVDEKLLGGMVIRINDRVVDSSVRSKLDDLTRQLLKIQLR